MLLGAYFPSVHSFSRALPHHFRPTGRPCAVNEADFDVKPPLDISDELLYEWEQSTQAAGHPVLKPLPSSSRDVAQEGEVNPWDGLLELNDIIANVTSTVYALKQDKSKMRENVQSLDERLTKMQATLPVELRWCVPSLSLLSFKTDFLSLRLVFLRLIGTPKHPMILLHSRAISVVSTTNVRSLIPFP
jgi:hypothetical protein